MFCNEKGCDCRRVLFRVVSIAHGGPVAVINWGWEHESFYAKWMKGSNRNLAKDLKGPSLNLGSPQSDLAPALLDLTENVLLKDNAYRERIKGGSRDPVAAPQDPTATGVALILNFQSEFVQFYEITAARKGYAQKMVAAVLDGLPEHWELCIVTDWSGGFWEAMKAKFPTARWNFL